MNNSDPLSKLIISESQEINKQELADLLNPYIAINKDSQSLDFFRAFRELGNEDKLYIVFAGIKARNLLFATGEKITPSEIIKMDIMPIGSVKGALKKLYDNGEVKSEKSKYFLPNYKLHQVIAHFRDLNKIIK